MKMWQVILLCIVGLAALIALSFGSGMLSLEFTKFFKPKFQNVERKVFEETQSYNHGMTRELADYYEQHVKAKSREDRQLIEEIIKIKFADYNVANLRSSSLKIFLSNVRGY